MNNFCSELIPEEIYIQIFSFLPSDDLLSLTLTCKNFNKIISNSLKLLKTFEIKINQRTIDKFKHQNENKILQIRNKNSANFEGIPNKVNNVDDFIQKVEICEDRGVASEKRLIFLKNFPLRKYSNFTIEGKIEGKILQKIIKNYTNSIQVLKIINFKMTAECFIKIFEKLKNLKQISFIKSEISNIEDFKLRKIDIKNFILIHSNLILLKVYENCNIRNLYIQDSKHCDWQVLNLIKNFTNLTIYNPPSSSFVSNFTNINISSVKRLKLLNLKFQQSSIPFDIDALKLDELILENVANCAEFVVRLMLKDSTKLKLLRSICIGYDGVTCLIVRQNRHKVEILDTNYKVPVGKPIALSVLSDMAIQNYFIINHQ